MLIGLYGVFAVGKTTFLRNIMDELAELSIHPLTVVLADLGEEYTYNDDGVYDPYWSLRTDRGEIWKGSKDEKIEHIWDMVVDTQHMWIVESARYFGGMQEFLMQAFETAGGGLHFIVPVTDEATGRQFLMDRCAKRNKEFRADYWDTKRLEYECQGRYQNVMTRHYATVGIPYMVLPISYERKEWEHAAASLRHMVTVPVNKWYGAKGLLNDKNSPDQGTKRERQDNHSQAAASTIIRQPYTGKR